jgi:purine nucleoside permease
VIVTGEVPTGVLPVVETVRVTGPAVTGLVGVNPQVAPVGKPEQARATVPLKLPWSATVREYEAEPPAVVV